MRTTLTIEPDVAARLEKLRRLGDRSLKGLVNELLRAGLDCIEIHGQSANEDRPAYRITPVASRPSVANLDDITEVLSVAEGEDHK